ncbi:nicotinate-nicotinamide nucleotide adenylyltransferase [Tepidibacter hydrothermalis]|uniref:nicotinate-nucleotide adenylyltransferase n=1 Tax=Tepidibacter hydrothermalis TaxID=3036126 RepID=A0ABY8EEF5_9FIRM|nr:cytidyltransferase [Tepidibacter hydrothermalis]WFD11334.1 cytidyltransferase [Tepidibacter hydrothermalis]
MQKDIVIDIHKEILDSVLNLDLSDKISRLFLKNNIDNYLFIANINNMIKNRDYTCKSILNLCQNILDNIHPNLSKSDWLSYTYNMILYKSFPDSVEIDPADICEPIKLACNIYIEIIRVFCKYEKTFNTSSFYIQYPLNFLDKNEIDSLDAKSEYTRFLRYFNNEYIYEMMKLNQEILNHNTLDHICGVHHLALGIARQIKNLGIPIDLGRVSGSAAGHDLGKFGCKKSESKRVPYLHYYYTDKWFKKHHITYIGHIALNHSVWDLELENLSIESLILIYCDFRVKNNDNSQMSIFSLNESFNIILQKLDNVDDLKKKRYSKVYAKLKDFENYLIHIGVDLGYSDLNLDKIKTPYYSLITGNKIIDNIKYLSVHHNINLMHKLRNEYSLNYILELARSENDGDNIRKYLQVFDEYSTYLTQNQKIVMLKFLYENLVHPDEDIRKQCAYLIGNLIAVFDENYRKEIPNDVKLNNPLTTSYSLLCDYLNLFINPDHKIIEIHKKWIGYNISVMFSSLFKNCNESQIKTYKRIVFSYYKKYFNKNNSIKLYLINAIKYIPITNDDFVLIDYILSALNSDNDNIRISALNIIYIILNKENNNFNSNKNINEFFEKSIFKSTISAENFLKFKISTKLNLNTTTLNKYKSFYLSDESKIGSVFLSNLKTLTPWIIKKINIDLLFEYNVKNLNNMAYTAMHFCNLLKVSGIESVRNTAGKNIIKIMPYLSLEERNDISIELLRSLEIEKYQFSKYIPDYLGEIILYLQPIELDEIIDDFTQKIKQSNNQIASLVLETVGITLKNYPKYKDRFSENEDISNKRLTKMLGILLNGLAHYDYHIKQTSFKVIGRHIFASKRLNMESKKNIFKLIAKKLLVLIDSIESKDIVFFTNAATLNQVYRFINEYTFAKKDISINVPSKVAFFPGTFDPFSVGHKEIAKAIQNLGFEVYLSVDEFSWSKKAQPNLFRRNIIDMSIANEPNIYLYPEDIPINISNPKDLKILSDSFPESDISIVIGSDVILNASAYKKTVSDYSIHNFSHIIFKRNIKDSTNLDNKLKSQIDKLEKNAILLNLPAQYEDVSSTQIRDYIDEDRDISELLDPLSQKYIYEKGLYQREPQYKALMKTISIDINVVTDISEDLINRIDLEFSGGNNYNIKKLYNNLKACNTKILYIQDSSKNNKLLGFCLFHQLNWSMLYKEFKNHSTSEYVRQNVIGKAVVVDYISCVNDYEIKNLEQILITEVLSFCIKRDYTYAIYKNNDNLTKSVHETLKLQGFLEVSDEDLDPIYIVNMTNPCVLTLDVESFIKAPFVDSNNVKKTILKSRKKLQKSLSSIYPGNLVLSFDKTILYENLIQKVCNENKVPTITSKPRKLGDSMCVPFGNLLKGIVVPNTVTKSLHTEKLFNPSLTDFTIASYPYYLDLQSQIKTIASFDKNVILIDDILNKGYRIKAIDPILKEQNVNVNKIIVGILSGRGKELMDIQNRAIDCAYFIPNLRLWFNENAMYPFIGGDTLWRGVAPKRNLIPSINMLFPYTSLSFVKNASKSSLYELSRVCIQNSIDILKSIEKEYEKIHKRKLTLNHLGEVLKAPRYLDHGKNMNYDLNLNPSHYLENDLELLKRMKNIIV